MSSSSVACIANAAGRGGIVKLFSRQMIILYTGAVTAATAAASTTAVTTPATTAAVTDWQTESQNWTKYVT